MDLLSAFRTGKDGFMENATSLPSTFIRAEGDNWLKGHGRSRLALKTTDERITVSVIVTGMRDADGVLTFLS